MEARPYYEFMVYHVAVPWKDSIVVVSEYETRSIWIYNLWTEQWRKYKLPKGKRLPVNDFQRGVEIGSDIYMFGGYSYSYMLWKLAKSTDDSFVWNTIKFNDCTKTPSLRQGHNVWKYKEKMWIFGGFGVSPAGYLNDHGDFANVEVGANGREYGHNNQLLSYDPLMQTWTNVLSSGDIPAPRRGASTATITHKVYLYGGWPSNESYRNNMYELDMQSVIWSQFETKGLIRSFDHTDVSLTPVTVNKLVFHDEQVLKNGVIWIFDVHSHTWKKHLEKKIGFHNYHTGITGLHGSVVILGDYYQPHNSVYNPVMTVRLEPKSLQQLAMQMIHQKVDPTYWEMLPKKLKCKMKGTE